MIPSSYAAIAAFLLIVAPGVMYERQRLAGRAPRHASQVDEASAVVLASLVFSTASLFVIAALNRWTALPLIDIKRLMVEGNKYAVDHLESHAFTAALQLALSVGLAVVVGILVARRSDMHVTTDPVWAVALRSQVPEGADVLVEAHLDSGEVIVGRVVTYTVDPRSSQRDLLLGAPLFAGHEGSGVRPIPDGTWDRIVVSGSALRNLRVMYAPATDLDSLSTVLGAPSTEPT